MRRNDPEDVDQLFERVYVSFDRQVTTSPQFSKKFFCERFSSKRKQKINTKNTCQKLFLRKIYANI